MNFKEVIKHGNELKEKMLNGYKLTAEDKEWFLKHPCYNEKYDFPCYQKDIIQLLPNCLYHLTIVEEVICHNDLIPIVSSVHKKGRLGHWQTSLEPFSAKILGVPVSTSHPIVDCTFSSPDGLMAVQYQHFYYDPKIKILRRDFSTYYLTFGMKKEVLSENTFRYQCKHPLDENNTFNGLTFSIHCERIEDVSGASK